MSDSDADEPPTKLSKMDNGDDDNTDASFEDEPVTGCISMPEISNLPEISDLPETTDLPPIDIQEATSLPAIDLQEATSLPAIDLHESSDLPALDLQESSDLLAIDLQEATSLPAIDIHESSNLPALDLQESSDLPALDLQEATDLPETNETPESTFSDLPALDLPEDKGSHMPELPDLPEIVNLPDITNLQEIGLPELSSIAEVSEERDNGTSHNMDISEMADISLPMQEGVTIPETDTAVENNSTVEMVEERLRDSLGSQEGQNEEWLSEGVLTDDDFNTSVEATNTNVTTAAPNTNGVSEPAEIKGKDTVTKEIEHKPVEQNIEDALNSLEGGMEEYEEFLVKKKDTKLEPANVKTENDKEIDDGNDTDDLLRMLGGDDNKTKKKLTKTVKDLRSVKAEMSSSEEEFEAQEAPTKKLKLSKALVKKDPPKPVQEESDDSSDDTAIMKKMFGKKRSTTRAEDARARVLQTKASINILTKNKKDKIATSTPLRQPITRSLLKPGANTPRAAAQTKTYYTSVQVKREPNPNTYSRIKPPVKKPLPTPSLQARKEEVKKELKEESELEEEYEANEEESESEEDSPARRRINSMKPEELEEDMMSDAESHSEDGSLYDELPSSDSDDIDDWFQLDVRAEKAGDYLPLLGSNAKEVLLEEKTRVAERLSNLKKSLSALTESGKKQAEQVRSATLALAELDDMLKAA